MEEVKHIISSFRFIKQDIKSITDNTMKEFISNQWRVYRAHGFEMTLPPTFRELTATENPVWGKFAFGNIALGYQEDNYSQLSIFFEPNSANYAEPRLPAFHIDKAQKLPVRPNGRILYSYDGLKTEVNGLAAHEDLSLWLDIDGTLKIFIRTSVLSRDGNQMTQFLLQQDTPSPPMSLFDREQNFSKHIADDYLKIHRQILSTVKSIPVENQ